MFMHLYQYSVTYINITYRMRGPQPVARNRLIFVGYRYKHCSHAWPCSRWLVTAESAAGSRSDRS
jgi:hypothetical protein